MRLHNSVPTALRALGFLLVLVSALLGHAADSSARSRAAHLKHGINIGSLGLNASPECCYRHADADKHIRQIKNMGFDHVRLGVHLGYFCNAEADCSLNNLNDLTETLKIIVNEGLAVIISIRVDDENGTTRFDLNDQAFIRKFATFWTSFSKALSTTSPDLVFFEIVNEPYVVANKNESESIEMWEGYQLTLAKAIHAGAKQHTVIATGAMGSKIHGLLLLKPLQEENVIYSFHYYDPNDFATNGKGGYPLDLGLEQKVIQTLDGNIHSQYAIFKLNEFDSYWNKKRIDSEIDQARIWRDRYGVVVICDEFGVNKKADAGERRNWIKDVRERLEKGSIGWTFWDYRDCAECKREGFGLLGDDGLTAIAGIVKALGRKNP
jgi:endoglucanase